VKFHPADLVFQEAPSTPYDEITSWQARLRKPRKCALSEVAIVCDVTQMAMAAPPYVMLVIVLWEV